MCMKRTLAAATLTLACAASLWIAMPGASAQDSAPNITVTSVPAAGEAGCLPAQEGASMTITDTPTDVVMTVTARNEVCGDVTAAVYAMPENRLYPWPQTKVESETFKIKPGVTTVRFAKTCVSAQFDLVTGETPQVINPDTGPMHGPLLFTIPWSGVQHWSSIPCTATTTTSPNATTTSTSPNATTTTTVPTQVGGITSTVPPTTSTSTTTVAVGGLQQQRPGTADTASTPAGNVQTGNALAATGVSTNLLGAWGAVLLIAGLLALAIRRWLIEIAG